MTNRENYEGVYEVKTGAVLSCLPYSVVNYLGGDSFFRK